MRELLHFAHGNGFPSLCYKQMLQALESRVECLYIDRLGHAPQYPVTENWSYLIDEVIASVQSQATRPVIGLGHSFGGVLTLLAAIRKPELFQCVILLDSPLLGRVKSNMVRFAKRFGMIDSITPAMYSRQRRQHWQTREDALAYFKSKPLFQTFTEACLEDYVQYGLQQSAHGYSLAFEREIEVRIYRTIPHILPQYEGKLRVPAALIYGRQSNMITRFERYYMKQYFGIHAFETNGTHMFPMERPKAIARIIMRVMDKI